jgi:hypothetical protein
MTSEQRDIVLADEACNAWQRVEAALQAHGEQDDSLDVVFTWLCDNVCYDDVAIALLDYIAARRASLRGAT